MAATGQSRRIDDARHVSASPPIAPELLHRSERRDVPEAEVGQPDPITALARASSVGATRAVLHSKLFARAAIT